MFSRVVAQLDKRVLSIAHRCASWLTSKALRSTHQWKVRLDDDDSVSACFIALFQLFGGLSTSFSMDLVGGKFGFFHGGLGYVYFVADPAQPLDRNLRATWVGIPPAKNKRGFRCAPFFVVACTWGNKVFQAFCTRRSFNSVKP